MPISATTHLLVSALSVHRKRAHSPSSKDEHSIGLKDSLLAHSSDPVEMRRLNYQTPGKEQLIPLNPASSSSPSPCPHARGRVAVLLTLQEIHTFSVTVTQSGFRQRMSKCLLSGLQILLPGPVTAGPRGWGSWMGLACCVLCVRHGVKLIALVLSWEEPPRSWECPHLGCSQELHWLHPGWASVLSTTGAVLATWAASGTVRRYLELLHC